jgi:N-acetylglucosaminyldiphosphoundecaprenol N-acetyl-beta-D-mannosaminyltransferase
VSLTTFFASETISSEKACKPFSALQQCRIAGVTVHRTTLEEASTQIIDALRRRRDHAPFLIMGPNAQLIALAQKDSRFAETLHASALNVPDGISIVLASKILGGNISTRVTGGDLMEALCLKAARHNLSVFFLGGLPGAAAITSVRFRRRYPALSIVGTYCPPLGFERDPLECAQIRQLITQASPDLLFVAFGAPKQEIWMHENCPSLPIGAAMSVGAAFDTQSGLRKRAPRWTHNLGLEWLYRLVHEPRRLWRRYLIGNTHFLYLVLKQRFLYGQSADREAASPSSHQAYKSNSHSPFIQSACEPQNVESQPYPSPIENENPCPTSIN